MSLKSSLTKRILMVGILCLMLLPLLQVAPGIATAAISLTGDFIQLPVDNTSLKGRFMAEGNASGGKYNPNGTGGATGIDFWVWGSPIYNYTIAVGGSTFRINGSNWTTEPTVTDASSSGVNRVMISGTPVSGLNFTRLVSFGDGEQIITIQDILTNTGTVALSQVATLDSTDPDQGTPIGLGSSTSNDVVSATKPNDLVLASLFGGAYPDGLTVGFGSPDSLGVVDASGSNSTNPYPIINSPSDPNGTSDDILINLAVNYDTLASGESKSVTWYIVFDDSKEEAIALYQAKAGNSADLSLAITDSPDPVTVGTPLTYSIVATNLGVTDTTGVVLTDPLPTGVTFDSVTSSQGSCTGGSTVVCDLGNLASGASATATIVVIPTALGTITNMASVSSDLFDFDPSNNSASETTTVQGVALNSVAITGPSAGTINTDYTFTANIDPTNATQPVTYVWQATGQSDVTHTGGASDTVTFNWNTGGQKSVTVTASNILGSVSDSHVISINSPPTANDDSPTVNEDSTNNTIDVLANDSDPDGDALTITDVGATNQGGSVTNNGTDITYTPAANFFGSESFSYTISDGNGGSDSATVTITVNSVNDAPTADDDTFSVPENSPAGTIVGRVSARDEDGDSLTYAITAGDEGKFAIGASTGQITLTTPLSFEDSPVYNLTVQVEDSGGLTDNATITVNVGNVSEPPISVTIDGPEIGGIRKDYSFTARVGSPIAKTPITYVWQATGQQDVTNTYNVGGLQDTVTFNWPITGTKTIMVTVSNASGSESDSQTITIENLRPVVSNVRITPSEPDPNGLPFGIVPTVGTTITVAYDYSDGDGHPERQTRIRWRRGDQIEQQEQPNLNDQHTVSGTLTTIPEELWCVIVTPHDGLSYGEPSGEDDTCVYIETIPNLVPIVEEANVTENPSSSDALEVSVKVTDPDASSALRLGENKIITETRWYRNGVFQPSYSLNTSKVLPEETNVGETWCARVRAFDGEGFGPEEEAECIIISPPENTRPVVEDLMITPEEPKDSNALVISYIFVDPGDTLRLGEGDTEIKWYRNGQIQPHLNNKRAVPTDFTAPGEKWWATVRPHDGVGYGRLDISPPVYIAEDPDQDPEEPDEPDPNTPPEVTNVLITPAEPGNQDPLKLRYTFIDADGDPQGDTIVRWFRDLAQMRDYDDLTVIPHGATNPGDRWHAVVIPHDGTEYGSDVAAESVMIGGLPPNTLPEARDVLLSPRQPGDEERLELDYVYYDENGDLEGDTQIRWTKNFLPQAAYNDRTVIPAGITQVGDTWCATVVPHDGKDPEEFGLAVPSNCVTIQAVSDNTPPEVRDAYILPAPPTSNDDLELYYEYFDADNDPEGYTNIRWYRNGVQQNDLNDQSVVRASHTSAGEEWSATIEPHDGTEYGGKSVTQAVTINSPPQAPIASIKPPEPFDGNDLVLAFDDNYQYFDRDRDPAGEPQIRWYKNGVHQYGYDDKWVVPGDATSVGESWHAEIAASDGLQYSERSPTNVVTILPNLLYYLPMIIRSKPNPDEPPPTPTPTPVPPTPTPIPTATPTPADPFEENDTQESAYGPLSKGEPYEAYPDDQDDWYYFNLYQTSSELELEVRNYRAEGQVVLYREELDAEGNLTRVFVANYGAGGSNMNISSNSNKSVDGLRPGKYLVRIYTVDDYREDAYYRLRVDYELR